MVVMRLSSKSLRACCDDDDDDDSDDVSIMFMFGMRNLQLLESSFMFMRIPRFFFAHDLILSD